MLWRAFQLPRYIAELKGDIDLRIPKFHERYGEVVRIAPDQLTFNISAAWKDIHGYGANHLDRDPLTRAIVVRDVREPGLVQADPANHSRLQREGTERAGTNSPRLR